MKKLIPLLVLLGVASAALAQGTVTFDNASLIGHPLVTDPFVRGNDGTRLDNAPGEDTLRFQLLYGTTAGSLTPHTQLARGRPAGSTSAGTWREIPPSIDANRALPIGGVGTTIFLQVRVWDATTANLDFNAARAQGLFWGTGAVFQYTQRQSIPPDPSDTWMVNFEGFTVVPEPSVIGLAVIGGAALFLLRRRK
jgi:hypothetical protein